MGNLNQFYLLGRIASAPVPTEGPKGPAVELFVQPGTGGRAPRGAPPLRLLAGGPQLEPAKALSEGEAVLLRGQLRQETSEAEGGQLVAWVQAIEPVVGEGGSAPTRSRRKRRRRPRKERGGEGGGSQREGGEAPAEPKKDPAADLPPPKPIAEVPAQPAEPSPSIKKDMPF